jgi:peptidoglycan-associated lipoprotein
LALGLVACKPDYPKCETDEHCVEHNGEVCVNGQCQECREQAQCDAKYPGATHECLEGRCEQKPECRADADCASVGADLVCRASKCVPECTTNTDCPGGKKCEAQKCVAECSTDVECGPNRQCADGACQDMVNEGTKVSASCRPMSSGGGEVVAMQVVRFEFNQYELTLDARNALDQNAACLKEAPQVEVTLEGHGDERGTQEYNLALGEKRANTVKAYLKNLGVDTGRLRTVSKGENEPLCRDQSEDCWQQNRRVNFIQRTRR